MSVGSVEKAALRRQAHVGEYSAVTQDLVLFCTYVDSKEKKTALTSENFLPSIGTTF